MRNYRKAFFVFALSLGPALHAQTADLRVTAQILRGSAEAMFGKLPKAIRVAQVQVCSNRADPVTLPLARIVQQVKLSNGATVLTGDAALAVVAAAQGSSPLQIGLRTASAVGAGIKSLAVLGVIQPNTSWGAALTMTSDLLELGRAIAGTSASSHQLLSIGKEMLPDPLSIAALGCAQPGIAIVEVPTKSKKSDIPSSIDFGMSIPTRGQQ